jgi:hypothetical protein
VFMIKLGEYPIDIDKYTAKPGSNSHELSGNQQLRSLVTIFFNVVVKRQSYQTMDEQLFEIQMKRNRPEGLVA